MRLMVVGVGALGSCFGGALAAAGHDVTLLIRNREHRDAIRAHGLELRLDSGNSVTDPTVMDAESADQAGLADIVIVFTKTGATRAALADGQSCYGPGRGQVEAHRGRSMVHTQIHEDGTALRGEGINNRSRRVTKCAKDSGHYLTSLMRDVIISYGFHLRERVSARRTEQSCRLKGTGIEPATFSL